MKKIILIAGKACAGKDTLVKAIMKEMNLPMALSFTTRPMRIGEKQGVEYDFIDEHAFSDLHRNDMLAEFTSYNEANGDTWYYGLTREELEKADYVLAIVNPEGARQIKEIYGCRAHVILITANDKERIYRYLERDSGNNVAECCRRFLADEKDFVELEYDYLVENDNFENAFTRLKSHLTNLKGNVLLEEMRNDFASNPSKYIGRKDA